MVFVKEWEENYNVCPRCDFHDRIGPAKRFEQLFDAAEYELLPSPEVREDPLRFRDSKRYTDRLKTARAATEERDALLNARGKIDEPQYYAFGPDIPRALQAVEAAQASTKQLDQELDAQLVGLAKLVTDPSQRTPITNQPTITVASDLHNNFLALPILEKATNGGPLFFAGDLTDRGSPLEARLVSRVVHLGSKFVFVSGNQAANDASARAAHLLADTIRLTVLGALSR